MAFKIVRQPKKIALLGSASSAASLEAGGERAATALRSAGLAGSLKSAGFEVVDHGDAPTALFDPDNEHPRARNVPAILKSLNNLRPLVEVAVKSGALPIILSGDRIGVMAVIAGVRRYHRQVSLIYMDRDVCLNVPATTSTGSIDGMVISHIIGRGAPELTRFWGEPPLVREPDIALFGYDHADPQEEQTLLRSPLSQQSAAEISAKGAGAAARSVVTRVHATKNECVLHLDVGVMPGKDFSGSGSTGETGLTGQQVREALAEFVRQPNLCAVHISGYNPERDATGEAARQLVALLAELLASRLVESSSASPAEPLTKAETAAPVPVVSQPEPELEPTREASSENSTQDIETPEV